jgi:hypothetical protein
VRKYTGTFKKKDGTLRTMHFISEADAKGTSANTTQITDHTQSHAFGHANENGMILVYDVEVDGFRYFNTKTQVGGIVTEVGWSPGTDNGSTRH